MCRLFWNFETSYINIYTYIYFTFKLSVIYYVFYRCVVTSLDPSLFFLSLKVCLLLCMFVALKDFYLKIGFCLKMPIWLSVFIFNLLYLLRSGASVLLQTGGGGLSVQLGQCLVHLLLHSCRWRHFLLLLQWRSGLLLQEGWRYFHRLWYFLWLGLQWKSIDLHRLRDWSGLEPYHCYNVSAKYLFWMY